MTALAVIAKAPLPGHVKTRLCPPLAPKQAAVVAEAALRDTLAVVAGVHADRHVMLLEGPVGPWLPAGFEVIAQRSGGLAERLAGAFEDLREPALVIGMDTPQVTIELLHEGLARLSSVDAVLGPAPDGGYWAIGLREADRRVFAGVPMSQADTAELQLAQLAECGFSVGLLPELRDFDTYADALLVARMAPGGCFARALAGAA